MTQQPTGPSPATQAAGPSRRTIGLLIGGGAIAVLAIGGFLAWQMFFGGSAPAPATIDDAVGVVTGSPTPGASAAASASAEASGQPSAAASAGASTGTGSGSGDVSGTWTVDTSLGSATDGTSAYVGFRVAEELNGIGATEAVGTTPGVTGSLTIDGTTLTAATIEADLTQITSDRSRRDPKIQEALETGAFPTATFTLTEPVDLGSAATTGETVTVTAVGDLTIHGQTVPTEFALEAKLVDGVIVAVGSTDATFTDWGITMPRAPIVLSVSDQGTIELQLFFTQG